MNRCPFHPVFFIISLMSVFGLFYMFFFQTKVFFYQLFVWAVVIGIIVLIFRMVMKRRLNKEYAQFLKAAKKSKKRYKDKKMKSLHKKGYQARARTSSSVKKRRNHNHLTVIEGKKGKKKNRALF